MERELHSWLSRALVMFTSSIVVDGSDDDEAQQDREFWFAAAKLSGSTADPWQQITPPSFTVHVSVMCS